MATQDTPANPKKPLVITPEVERFTKSLINKSLIVMGLMVAAAIFFKEPVLAVLGLAAVGMVLLFSYHLIARTPVPDAPTGLEPGPESTQSFSLNGTDAAPKG